MLVLRDWRHLVGWPGLLFALVLGTLILGHFDRPIAQLFFYSADTGWLGTGGGDWWAHDLIHDAGRWLPRIVAALALVGWLASFKVAALKPWRREIGFVFLGMALSTVLVGALKELTNVDCPWDLEGFGGTNPYVPLFADRPDSLPRAACFPGAHSSSGFALLAIYFALRDRARRIANAALVFAIAVGTTFALGQEARGAHFVTDDLASAAIVWFLLTILYSRLLAPRPKPYK